MPVDETETNEGNCGIPKHLDMYGAGAINGMEFQMDNEMDAAEPVKLLAARLKTRTLRG